jgi:hypothetical protein
MINVIEADGSPEDIGRSIGTAVADSFADAVLAEPEFMETEALFAGSPYLAHLFHAADATYPTYMRELTAMADAIGIDPMRLFLWNCRGDLRFPPETAQARLDALSDGCTTLMAPGDFAQDKPAVIAHNEDGSGAFMNHRYWVRVRPDAAPGFESFLYPGMLPGHSVAVNGAGLVQTINNIRASDLKPGIPRHFVCRAILDEDSIPSVIGHLARRDRASGFHHALGMIGEESPLSVETPASTTIIRTVATPMAHANHLLDDTFEDSDQAITASSKYRQDTVDRYLAEGGDPHTPEAILFQRSDGASAGHGESVLRRPGDGGDDYGCTLATAVFRIYADHIAWTVHGSPDDLDALQGTVTL